MVRQYAYLVQYGEECVGVNRVKGDARHQRQVDFKDTECVDAAQTRCYTAPRSQRWEWSRFCGLLSILTMSTSRQGYWQGYFIYRRSYYGRRSPALRPAEK